MVVADKLVVDQAAEVGADSALKVASCPGAECRVAECCQSFGDGGHYVCGDVAAVGSGVCYDLVDLVESLKRVQSLLSGKAQHVVGIPLELGQVIGKRRFFSFGHFPDAGHGAACTLEFLYQRVGLLLLGNPDAVVLGVPGGLEGAEIGLQRPVETSGEVLDLVLAAGDQCKRRGLDASGGKSCIEVAAHGPGDVVSDVPVGIGTAFGSCIEIVVVACGLEVLEALFDCHIGLAADPEPLCRLGAACLLEDPAGNKLAFASCIGCYDDALDILPVQKGLDDIVLVLALLNDHGIELLRKNRKVAQVPMSVFRPVVVGGTEGHQVPEGPGNHVVVALKVLAPVAASQHAGKLFSYTRLLSQN